MKPIWIPDVLPDGSSIVRTNIKLDATWEEFLEMIPDIEWLAKVKLVPWEKFTEKKEESK